MKYLIFIISCFFAVAIHAKEPLAYSAISKDGGKTWQYTYYSPEYFKPSPLLKNIKLYENGEVFFSNDYGKTWTKEVFNNSKDITALYVKGSLLKSDICPVKSKAKIDILDIDGNLIKTIQYDPLINGNIDLNGLNNSAFIFKAYINESVMTFKCIIQK